MITLIRLIIKTLFLVTISIAGILAFLFVSLPNVSKLRTENPVKTQFMRIYLAEVEDLNEEVNLYFVWRPLTGISGTLQQAVVAAEDDSFYQHHGFDFKQMREAFLINWKTKSMRRGASTITQQLVKNLYLRPDKNPFRKIREWIITYQMEKTLSKRRILELYLNVVEWGTGIYGAEAAAQHYFDKSAGGLSPREAAYLAAILPNPRLYTSRAYSKTVHSKVQRILRRMGR